MTDKSLNRNLQENAKQLSTDIVTLVVDMAHKRSQLVDFGFLADFLDLLYGNRAIAPRIKS